MIENEIDLSRQIIQEKEKSLATTMWGKYANDIITGISNNSSVLPNRAVWELVQNARDVSKVNGKAEIKFIRKQNEFVFEHNGQPFDRDSILALIIQTSSKVRNDIVKVGQYGTGFLTTHKFGLKFKLEGALRVASDKNYFYNFGKHEPFIIDRSSRDKVELSSKIQEQVEVEQKWGDDLNQLQTIPCEYTVFTYLHEHDVERTNVADAFKKSPELAPYVLALNPLVGSITFQDDVDGVCETYNIGGRAIDWESESILLERVTIVCREKKKSVNLYLLKSKTETDIATQESKVAVILPWMSGEDLKPYYYELCSQLPQLYLYLPLLGTESWGWNYIIHAPAFTCDKDTRDSLLFVGNGQNNDDQAEQNKNLIAFAGNLIKEFFAAKLTEFSERKYLGRVSFLPAPQERLTPYYTALQYEWVYYFEQQPLVKQADGYIAVINIRTLDNELYKACEEDSELVDALYMLLSKDIHGLTLPLKNDLVHWSKYVDEWYIGRNNPHSLSLKDVCDKIKATTIDRADIPWLRKICLYLKGHPHSDIVLRSIVPNENLQLVENELVRPIAFVSDFRFVLKTLVPKEVEKFVHADFVDIMSDADEYGQEQAKTAITAFVTGINTNCTALKNSIVGNTSWKSQEYEDKYLSSEVVKAILDLYKLLLPVEGTGFSSRIYNLLAEYYDYSSLVADRIEKECFDIRNCYTILINDSLLRFSLLEDKSQKLDWVLRMDKELYGFAEAQSFLRNYMVYPNQSGTFKYSCQLKKQQSMPERLKEMYNIICSRHIQEELVATDFQDYFVETGVIYGQKLAEEIQEPFVKSEHYSIDKKQHQELYIEIIQNFSIPKEGVMWSTLFSDFNSHKATMMLSVINSPSKQESIFQLMKVQDPDRLNVIAELSKLDDFDRIIQLGKEARIRKLQEKNDFEFKKTLGLYVEEYLLAQLNECLGSNQLKVAVIDEQGGQDLKLVMNGVPIYFIEVKSRWESDRSVLMSTLQHQTSYKEKEHYALCVVDMSQYDRSLAEQHIYPEVDEIKGNIQVLMNIGTLNERMKDAVEDDGDEIVHIAGGYQVLVPQTVIKANGKSFDQFVDELKTIVASKIS